MKITVEDGGQVMSIETERAIVIAQSDSIRMEAVKGSLLELGMLLGDCKPLAERWDTLRDLVAIMKTMKADEDTVGGTEVLQ